MAGNTDFVAIPTLEARNQIATLLLAAGSSLPAPHCGPASPPPTLARHAHTLARLLWDVARATTTSFVVVARGMARSRAYCPDDDDADYDETLDIPAEAALLLRVSPLLGSVVGHAELRDPPGSQGRYWATWRWFVQPRQRPSDHAWWWCLVDSGRRSPARQPGHDCDGGGEREWAQGLVRGVAPCTWGFSGLGDAVNARWLVQCGRIPGGYGGGMELVLITHRLRVPEESSGGTGNCCADGGEAGSSTIVHLPDSFGGSSPFTRMILTLTKYWPDELVLVVVRPEDPPPHLYVVDLAKLHSTGKWSFVSMMPVTVPLHNVAAALAMRKSNGAHTFLVQGHTSEGYWAAFLVESNCESRKLHGACSQLSACEYVIESIYCSREPVEVWDCNEPTKPSKVVPLERPSNQPNTTTVTGASGFLFDTDTVASHFTIIDPTSQKTVLRVHGYDGPAGPAGPPPHGRAPGVGSGRRHVRVVRGVCLRAGTSRAGRGAVPAGVPDPAEPHGPTGAEGGAGARRALMGGRPLVPAAAAAPNMTRLTVPLVVSAHAMRKRNGSRSFLVQGYTSDGNRGAFQVEEISGDAIKLGHSCSQLSDCEYLAERHLCYPCEPVEVWDCNDPTKPSKVVPIDFPKGREGISRVTGASGFLFYTNPDESCFTVMDPTSRLSLLTVKFPQWQLLRLSIEFSH
ncbi:hypothetical protein Pelo_7136 [Pelomyxa schiedti]|nr:hypothetical protein Pelo_7136 [Pelomyxa schiedti]